MKYKLTSNSKVIDDNTLYRIQCETAFDDVNVGDLGGWIQSESNLSQDGNCWVYDDAYISDNGNVSGDAVLKNMASVCMNADVSGTTTLLRHTCITDNAIIGGDSTIVNLKIDGDAIATNGIHRLANSFWEYNDTSEAFTWLIFTTDTELFIGCIRKSFEFWDNATDEQISEMHPSAVAWWTTAKADVMQFVRDNTEYE